jgi:hypothetical protein
MIKLEQIDYDIIKEALVKLYEDIRHDHNSTVSERQNKLADIASLQSRITIY